MKLNERYSHLAGKRSEFLTRGQEFSKMTLPYLLKSGTASNTHGYQGLGSELVNHLANKMVSVLFPVGESFFVLDLDPDLESAMKKRGVEKTEISKYFDSIVELTRKHSSKMKLRSKFVNYMKHLIVAGNACFQFTETGAKVHGLDRYVVLRSPEGDLVEGIIEEEIERVVLPKEIQELLIKRGPNARKKKKEDREDIHKLYTSYSLQTNGSFLISQCVDDIPIKETNSVSREMLPVTFGRWNSQTGEDYGRGLVEDHRGDINAYEFLSYARARGCAVMMDVKYLVRPGSLTDVQTLNKAELGEFVQGVEGDISVLQLEKYADNRLIQDVINEYTQRLYRAFQKLEGVIRDSERTTKYEVQRVANELEIGLGGVYTVQSEDLQPMVAMQLLDKVDPSLINEDFTPSITTGLEALGRSRKLEKILQYSEMMAIPQGWPEALQARIDWNAYEAYITNTLTLEVTFLKPAKEVEEAATANQEGQVTNEMAQSIASGAGQAIGKRIGEGTL